MEPPLVPYRSCMLTQFNDTCEAYRTYTRKLIHKITPLLTTLQSAWYESTRHTQAHPRTQTHTRTHAQTHHSRFHTRWWCGVVRSRRKGFTASLVTYIIESTLNGYTESQESASAQTHATTARAQSAVADRTKQMHLRVWWVRYLLSREWTLTAMKAHAKVKHSTVESLAGTVPTRIHATPSEKRSERESAYLLTRGPSQVMGWLGVPLARLVTFCEQRRESCVCGDALCAVLHESPVEWEAPEEEGSVPAHKRSAPLDTDSDDALQTCGDVKRVKRVGEVPEGGGWVHRDHTQLRSLDELEALARAGGEDAEEEPGASADAPHSGPTATKDQESEQSLEAEKTGVKALSGWSLAKDWSPCPIGTLPGRTSLQV